MRIVCWVEISSARLSKGSGERDNFLGRQGRPSDRWRPAPIEPPYAPAKTNIAKKEREEKDDEAR